MSYKFNPFTGTFDDVGPNNGNGVPGGSNTQVQFNDNGVFGGDADLTWNKSTNVLTNRGDINLDDGGSFTTTIQCVTPTANRTISFPDATGTVGLVAGSSGQLVANQSGAYAGVANSSVDNATGNVTLGSRFISSLNGAASAPPGAFTGTWFTGGTSTTTKPQVLIEPTGATSTAWSTSGTGLGVNAASGFAGNLLDLQVNGTSRFAALSGGSIRFGTNQNTSLSGFDSDSYSTWWLAGGNRGGFLADAQIAIGSAADVRLFRDAANTLAQRNGTAAQTFRVYNTYTSGTNYELGKLEWSSNVFRIGTEKGSGGGTARSLELQTDGTTRLTINTAGAVSVAGSLSVSNTGLSITGVGGNGFYTNGGGYLIFKSDGVLTLSDADDNGFGRLQFGGTTSSFPALKRNAAVLETKLADDSAYAQHAASVFQAATAHTVATLPGTPTVGMIARVTDATAPAVGSPVSGSGAAAALVWYNGAQWTVIGV